MRFIRVAGAAVNQTPLDWTGNLRRIKSVIHDAKKQKVQLLVLPELCLTAYGCEDLFFSLETSENACKLLSQLLPLTSDIAVLLGMPIYFEGALYNCAVMIADGKILGCYAKKHLAREGVHYEPRWFQPWPQGIQREVEVCGQVVPLGDFIFKFGDIGVAVEICRRSVGFGACSFCVCV
ncbi:MAG: nitrilase-related carbon-nitrogen hydrolase [Bdellovibrionota bacterium]